MVKPPASFEKLVHILKSRELIVQDDDLAIRTLRRINYYRLSAYGLSLKRDDAFFPGTTFEHLLALYEFDQRFRYVIMEIVEQVEIAFRTHVSYHIAHKYGAMGHLDTRHYDNHDEFIIGLDKEIGRSQELFIKHHIEKYEGQVPVWVAVEVLSFGALSKLFSNMKSEDQNAIARCNYKVPAKYLVSWLKCLSYIRNICAHYGRLYNRPLTSKPRLNRYAREALGLEPSRVFAILYILKELIPNRRAWMGYVTRFEALLTEFQEVVELRRIGFPEDWESILVMKK